MVKSTDALFRIEAKMTIKPEAAITKATALSATTTAATAMPFEEKDASFDY